MRIKRKIALVMFSVSLALFAAGCKKKPPPAPPPPPAPVETPPPPPPARPTVTLSAEPSSIERGGSATLRWQSQNATGASLNQGIGNVPTTGQREVFPTRTTEYTLSVEGEGGAASASATVTVRTPPPPPPPEPQLTFNQVFERSNIRDIYFDFDKSEIRPDQQPVLQQNSGSLKDLFATYDEGRVLIEGHCDERGTNEYNLALGDRRATATREYLVNLGVPESKLSTVSYGEERPVCDQNVEECWQRNRRAHFAAR